MTVAVAAVAARDPIADELRVGDEMRDARAAAPVPVAQPVEHAMDERAAQPGREPARCEVLVPQVPCVAHRRVAIADVELRGRRPHALGDGVRAGDDEVVGGDVERFDRPRKQRQQQPKVTARTGHSLQERRARALAEQPRPLRVGQEVDQREEVALRIGAHDFREHVFAAAPGVEPIVHDGDARRRHEGASCMSAKVALSVPVVVAAHASQEKVRARARPAAARRARSAESPARTSMALMMSSSDSGSQ